MDGLLPAPRVSLSHRITLGVMVIVCHVMALQWSWLPRALRRAADVDAVLWLTPVQPRPLAAKPEVNPKPSDPYRSDRYRNEPSPSPAEVPLAPVSEQSPVSPVTPLSEASAPIVDWQRATAAAVQAAAQAAVRQSATREFGKASSATAAAVKERAPSVFKDPKHQFGETSTLVNGDSVLWLSEHCYQVLNSDESHFKAFSAGVPDRSHGTTKCVYPVGKPKPNAELFAHMDPE